jgi:Ca-activated chloride channel homolog
VVRERLDGTHAMRWFLIVVGFASLAAAPQERPLFSAQSDLVVVHAMVEDGRGAAVPGLTQENFLVYEDNRPQQISFFSSADAPASIGLLIDSSTSMVTKRDRVIAAAVQFAELSNPDDEVFVLAFNEQVRVAWAPRLLHASDLSDLRATLKDGIVARGQTALFDAIESGLDRLARGKHARQVLVIVSDGSDNASRSTLEETFKRIGSTSAMVYAVALQDDVDRDGNPKLLKRIATATGGETFVPRKTEDVAAALEHIARDIRASYTLGYVPTNQLRDGTIRRLRVSARHPDGRTLKVQTRGGYIAPTDVGQR